VQYSMISVADAELADAERAVLLECNVDDTDELGVGETST
jgi:hypothetical protein